jgi:hypothetical protein
MNDEETNDLARMAALVSGLLEDAQENRAEMRRLVEAWTVTESIEARTALIQAVVAANALDGRPAAAEPSEIQGRTIFDYAVLSGLLGRGSLPLVLAEREKGVTRFSPLSDKGLPRDATTAWFQSAPDEAGDTITETVDLVREDGVAFAPLLFRDDRAVDRIELRNASGLPVALANALPAL